MLKINKKLKRIKENFCFEMIVMGVIDIIVSYTFFYVCPLWLALIVTVFLNLCIFVCLKKK